MADTESLDAVHPMAEAERGSPTQTSKESELIGKFNLLAFLLLLELSGNGLSPDDSTRLLKRPHLRSKNSPLRLPYGTEILRYRPVPRRSVDYPRFIMAIIAYLCSLVILYAQSFHSLS